MGLRGRFPGWVVGLLLVACAVVLAFALMQSVNDGLVVAAMLIGCGFAAVIVFGGAVSLAPDDTRSEATERTLRVATGTLAHLRGGLTEENARAICALLLPFMPVPKESMHCESLMHFSFKVKFSAIKFCLRYKYTICNCAKAPADKLYKTIVCGIFPHQLHWSQHTAA